MYAFGCEVTRLRPGPKPDRYSAQRREDWRSVDRTVYLGCGSWQESSILSTQSGADLRTEVVTVQKFALPYDADVRNGDRLVVGDVTFEVQGELERYNSFLTGWKPGSIATGVRVDG